MTAPTGNVWMDPDTGKPANPQNVQQDMGTGIPFNRKYGPGVRDTGLGSEVDRQAHRLDRDPVADAAAAELAKSGDASGIVQRKFGSIGSSAGPKPDGAATARGRAQLDDTKITARELGHESVDKKVSPEQRARARIALEQLARNEFGRPDGARKEIVAVLKRYDITPASFRPAAAVPDKEE